MLLISNLFPYLFKTNMDMKFCIQLISDSYLYSSDKTNMNIDILVSDPVSALAALKEWSILLVLTKSIINWHRFLYCIKKHLVALHNT